MLMRPASPPRAQALYGQTSLHTGHARPWPWSALTRPYPAPRQQMPSPRVGARGPCCMCCPSTPHPWAWQKPTSRPCRHGLHYRTLVWWTSPTGVNRDAETAKPVIILRTVPAPCTQTTPRSGTSRWGHPQWLRVPDLQEW